MRRLRLSVFESRSRPSYQAVRQRLATVGQRDARPAAPMAAPAALRLGPVSRGQPPGNMPTAAATHSTGRAQRLLAAKRKAAARR